MQINDFSRNLICGAKLRIFLHIRKQSHRNLATFFEIVFQGWQNTYAISVV